MVTELRRGLSHGRAPQSMIAPFAFHAPDGRSFLGVVRRRDGGLEIIYDKFDARRSVWEVMTGNIDIEVLKEACRSSVMADDCLGTLHARLAGFGIWMECKEDRIGANK